MITLTGYSDKISARSGETIQFKVSAEDGAPYTADIVRLRCGDTNPKGPGFKEEVIDVYVGGQHQGRKQNIHIGSCVFVPWALALAPIASFSVTAIIWPTTPGNDRIQAIISCWSEVDHTGFTLGLDESGAVALTLGNNGMIERVTTATPILERQWCWVGATFDQNSKTVSVFQQALYKFCHTDIDREVRKQITLDPSSISAPIVIGALLTRMLEDHPLTTKHYNGKIDSPRLARAKLGQEQLQLLQYKPIGTGATLVAAWDFSKEIPTTHVLDTGPNKLHGETINLPARGMTGWNWHGTEMGWPNAPEQYGAIHFHDDDLYDAGWDTDFTYTIPEQVKSGLYAARLRGRRTE